MRARCRRGQSLVEFALVSLALYFLIAAVLDFGRAIYVAQGLQAAADLMARELSRTPLPATETFDAALDDPTVKQTIFNKDLLAVDITGQDLATVVATWPIVNQQLAPLMIVTQTADGHQVLQYPGELVDNGGGSYSVNVYELQSDGSISAVNIVEEIQAGAFSIASSAHGVVGVHFNYPFHAATLSSYTYTTPSGTPYTGIPIGQNNVVSTPVQNPDPLQPGQAGGPYSGAYGLGQQAAMGKTVVPFSRIISAQGVYRREVFE